MTNWYETTVKYERVIDDGNISKITQKHLIDALSFSEAEERIIQEMKPFISGEFDVTAIRRIKINELFFNENGDKWFKAKVNFITLDEQKGVERKQPAIIFVQANDLKEAREFLVDGLKGTLSDYETEAVAETKIIDVLKYKAK